MLIESYVVEFKEVKNCVSSLRSDDFLIVSANIFALTEKMSTTNRPFIGQHSRQSPRGLTTCKQGVRKKSLHE